ncbi:hypothetical protein EV182_002537 [Spiromyces aspiralis]|uniref:Uncharacterized protein n=1 Tax=Spiromyces aspiralis TaxID=68401 RepID=A0ACC1HLK6_9FUNG|nr:hypothetical protein EV182_002537 [Spiromyces aspiralis]
MLSYRELAIELTEKVNAAIKKRETLLKDYEATKRNLHLAQQDNDHLLDLLMELSPDADEDLYSSDSSSLLYNDGRRSDYEPNQQGRGSGSGDEDNIISTVDEMLAKRRCLDKFDRIVSPRLTKRRRRQGKRDDRRDPKPIEELARDEDGNIIFPIVVGRGNEEQRSRTVSELIVNPRMYSGRVIWDRENYHTSRYIWPVGFKSTKILPSMLDENKKVVYTSEILENGDSPIFKVTAEDQPGRDFTGSSSSGVWKQILDAIMAKGVGVKTHASGPQMYGLSNLGITKAIQELPGAEKCTKYVMQQWIQNDDMPGSSANDDPVTTAAVAADINTETIGEDNDPARD